MEYFLKENNLKNYKENKQKIVKFNVKNQLLEKKK